MCLAFVQMIRDVLYKHTGRQPQPYPPENPSRAYGAAPLQQGPLLLDVLSMMSHAARAQNPLPMEELVFGHDNDTEALHPM